MGFVLKNITFPIGLYSFRSTNMNWERLHHNKNRTSFPKKLKTQRTFRISHPRQFFCHNFFILMFHNVLNQGILSLINYTSAGSPAKMEENNELVFASFNQDTTSLAVGTTNGYKLYSLTSTDSLEPIYSNGEFTLFFLESWVCEIRFYKIYFKRNKWFDIKIWGYRVP